MPLQPGNNMVSLIARNIRKRRDNQGKLTSNNIQLILGCILFMDIQSYFNCIKLSDNNRKPVDFVFLQAYVAQMDRQHTFYIV